MIESSPWWKSSLEAFLGAGIPVILWMLDNRRRARNQVRAEQERTRLDLASKHAENTRRLDAQDQKLDDIINERLYIPAHMHRESRGPLTAENIHFPPRNK